MADKKESQAEVAAREQREAEGQVRIGSDVDPAGTEDFAERASSGGEISSNGVFTKVLRGGHVEILPTSEVYAKEADERVKGIEVADSSVSAATESRGALLDRAAMEFNTGEQGDTVSAHHAQGAAGTIARESWPEAKLDEGAYEKEQEKAQKQAEKDRKAAAKKADS
jgi:hypothetical protein